MGSYAGESRGKQAARVMMYMTVGAWWMRCGVDRDKAAAVVVAGPDAHEVNCLRWCLGLRPENVTFVDTDARGLREAERKWPGVRTFHGKLHNVPIPNGLRFCNVDLMGHFNSDADLALRHVGPALRKRGGVATFTYLRGREFRETPRLAHMRFAAAALRDALRTRPPPKDWREDGYRELVRGALGDATLWSRRPLQDIHGFDLGSWAYHSGRSPMGVVGVGFDSRFHATGSGAWYAQDFRRCDFRRGRGADTLAVLEVADLFRKMGRGDDLPAWLMGIPKGTLAAWRAHRTMGTYGKGEAA